MIVLITLVANRGTGNLNLPANLCGLFWDFRCAYQTAALGTSFIRCSHWPQLQAVAYRIRYSGNKDCVNTDGSETNGLSYVATYYRSETLQPLKSFGFLLLLMHMHLSAPRKFQQPRSCASVSHSAWQAHAHHFLPSPTSSVLFLVPSDLNCFSSGSQKHQQNGWTLQKR